MLVMEGSQVRNLPKDASVYFQAVRKHLCLPGSARKKVLQELKEQLLKEPTDYSALIQKYGTPKAHAELLNRRVPGYVYQKCRWCIPCLILGILSLSSSLFFACILGIYQLILSHPDVFFGLYSPVASVGQIGQADGPTAVYITSIPAGNTAFLLLVSLLAAIVGFTGYYRLRHQKISCS